MTAVRSIHLSIPSLLAGSSLAFAAALVAILTAGLLIPRPNPALADNGPLVSPVAWKTYPTNDSVEMGDHALNLNFNFGGPNSVISSAAHNLHYGRTGQPSGYTVLLRTSSDGATRKLPPTTASLSRLSSTRVGLTPTSTLVQGSTSGLRLTYQVTKPYLPTDSITERAAQLTNGPFMYLRLVVENLSASAKPASAIYLGFGSSCGPPIDESPQPGWRTLRMCNDDDAGGTRYLAVPKTPGSTWATGTDTVADFADDGALSQSSGAGDTAVALPVPSLPAKAVHQVDLVYGAWNQAAGITAVNGDQYPFYYRRWWSDRSEMLNFAIDNLSTALAGSAAFDQQVRQVSADSGAQYGAVHAFRGWRHANWLVAKPDGAPFYAVTEGGFNYLSTIDVGYEYHVFQTRYEPWKSKLELDQWRTRYEVDASGNKFLVHDLGKDTTLTAGPAYDLKSGLRRHMPVEHNLDMVAMIFAWEDRTGRGPYDRELISELLDAAESHDVDQDGSIDKTEMTACLAGGGRCRTSQLGTTYDGAVSLASKVQAGNTILTTKLGVVESFADDRGYLPGSGASYATRSRRHLEAARRFRNQVSSDVGLSGYEGNPGYLSDALLYAPILGRNPILDGALATWLNDALVDNQAAVHGAYASTAVARNSSVERIVWISKALDGDAVGAWIQREWPTWRMLRPEGPKLWATWNKRISGTAEGTFDFARYPNNAYWSAGWYPRSASIWGAAEGWPAASG